MDIRKFMKKSSSKASPSTRSRQSLESQSTPAKKKNGRANLDGIEDDDEEDFQISRKRTTRSRRGSASTKVTEPKVVEPEPNPDLDEAMDIDDKPATKPKPKSRATGKRGRVQKEDAQPEVNENAANVTGFGGPSDDIEAEEALPKPPTKKPKWMPRSDDPPNRGSKSLPIGRANCLAGKVFVITGVLDSLLRDECSDLCKEYGARVVGSVSKKVTHGIIGTEPGASKMTKLKANKTPLIDEDQLFEMINSTREKEEPKKEKIEPTQEKTKSVVKEEEDDITPAKTKRGKKGSKVDSSSKKASGTQKSSGNAHSLWVDKYKPSSASDLVANPKAIKDLKNWLNDWKNKFLYGDAHSWKTKDRGDQGYAAALLIGSPGIGKTSAAHIVCKECGFEPHEFNASDVRNKGGIASLADTAMIANTIGKYLKPKSGKNNDTSYPEGQVLIMDEVDGMSGGDRGGSQELIKLIKKTKVPIICIANDDSSSNMRSLANNCFKLRFRRPMVTQVSKRLMEIARREGFHAMQDQILHKLAEGCNGDIRQMINLLQTWRTESADLSFADVKNRMIHEGKTVIQKSIFELARTFFSPGIDGSPNSLYARNDNFFADSDLVPLFMHENFPNATGATMSLDALADAAESISEGDLCSALVRGSQRWDLMPSMANMSTIRPGSILAGGLGAQLKFPAFLGNLSKGNKWKRIVQGLEMKIRATHTSTGSTEAFRLDYIPALTTVLATPLIRDGAVGIDDVIGRLDAYYLERDPDWTEVMEAGVYAKGRSPLECIKKPVLTALTKEYNTRVHQRSAVTGERVGTKASTSTVVKSTAAAAAAEDVAVVDDDGEEESSEKEKSDDEEDVAKQFGVKAKKGRKSKSGNTPVKATKKKTSAKSAGRGRGKSTGRGRSRTR